MTPGTSVSAHVLKMKGLIDQLDKISAPISHELATDLILGSLPESYDQFFMNSICTIWRNLLLVYMEC